MKWIYPVKIYEYMALCVFPVCTDLVGVRDIVQDGVSGFILRSASSTDLCQIFARLAANRPLVEKMREPRENARRSLTGREYIETFVETLPGDLGFRHSLRLQFLRVLLTANRRNSFQEPIPRWFGEKSTATIRCNLFDRLARSPFHLGGSRPFYRCHPCFASPDNSDSPGRLEVRGAWPGWYSFSSAL